MRAAIIGLLALLLISGGRARADSGEFLTASVVVSNATATVTSTPATLNYKGGTLLIMPTFSAEGTSTTSNVVFNLDVSADGGSTYTTTRPLTYSLSSNGTNSVVGLKWYESTNFLNGVNKVKLSTIVTTQTNNVTVTSVKWYHTSP